MDIKISRPINISLDVLELDEHLPSMKFEIIINVNKFGYSLDVSSQVWVECQNFDLFIDNLSKGNAAILNDMNGLFELKLDSAQEYLKWLCSKEDRDNNTTSATGKEYLTDESRSLLYKAFNDFPKWW